MPDKCETTSQNVDELRLDYAWKWFEFHARQRTTMFNFFLIIVGVLAAAFVSLLTEGAPGPSAGIAAFGILVSIGFMFLDARNKTLLKMGEDVLVEIEREKLFADMVIQKQRNYGKPVRKGENSIQLGMLLREEKEERRGDVMYWLTRHSVWIPVLQASVAVAFVLGLALSLIDPGLAHKQPDETQVISIRIDNIEDIIPNIRRDK